MKFETAKKLVKGMLLAGAVFCLASILLRGSDEVLAGWLMLAGGACAALCAFFMFTGLKCPYCGKRIISNSMNVTICPHCRRDLASGLRVKHKRK